MRATMLLFIVARGEPHLYETLRREFAGEPSVEIVLDRRVGERRRGCTPPSVERRQGERRSHAEAEDYLRTLGWAVVRREVPVT